MRVEIVSIWPPCCSILAKERIDDFEDMYWLDRRIILAAHKIFHIHLSPDSHSSSEKPLVPFRGKVSSRA